MQNIDIISIEGNIGSGKSTVIENLKRCYKGSKDIYFLEEPVSEWVQIKDSTGKNIIEKFYEDQEEYSFSFQMMAYISRLSMLKKAIQHCINNNINIIICERSLQTDKNVFCKMLHNTKKIKDINYIIYLKWFDEFINDIPPIYFIYIKTDPTIANARVIQRNRKGENISIDYLKMCNDYHNVWLENPDNNSVIINGNGKSMDTFNRVNDIIINWYKVIM